MIPLCQAKSWRRSPIPSSCRPPARSDTFERAHDVPDPRRRRRSAPRRPGGRLSVARPAGVRLWQLTDLIAYLVLLAIVLLAGLFLVWLRRALAAPVAAVWLLFLVLAAWTILYYHPRNYRAWGYHLDRRVLLIRKGVWFRSIKLLPLPRLQHVDVKRGPLQRHFGLGCW